MTEQHSSTVPADVWAAVTTQVAWTLLSEGIRVRPDVLADAREHALLTLHRAADVGQAGDVAIRATRELVARARGRGRVDEPPALPLSPRWHRALRVGLGPLSEALLREHFGNGRSLGDVAAAVHVDVPRAEMARSALRDSIRQLAAHDGVPLGQLPTAALDGLLSRLAVYAPGPCPPVGEILDGGHGEHVARCARCDRMRRLSRTGVLTSADLAPEPRPTWPRSRVAVMAIQLHPHARAARKVLRRSFASASATLGEDLVLVDAGDEAAVLDVLAQAASIETPRREHLRAARTDGPGRWSRLGLLGPVPQSAFESVRGVPWGVAPGPPLPTPLPPAPSARRAWGAVAVLGVVTAAAGYRLAGPPATSGEPALVADFTPGSGGIWAQVDVDDAALLTLVRLADGRLDVVLASEHPADKAAVATGDGAYRLHLVGSGVLVAASDAPLADVQRWVADANREPEPLRALRDRLRAEGDVEVASYTRPNL